MGAVIGRVSEEQPQYSVLQSTPDYEVRRYSPQLAATHTGGARTSDAFRALAAYCGIFTKPQQVDDSSKAAISMTSPVLMEMPDNMHDDATMRNANVEFMAFFLPAKFNDLESAPKPLDTNIKVIQLPERVLAVHTFNGNVTSSVFAEKVALLKQLLHKNGITVTDDKPMFAGYNPPFTIPYFKKNEVLLPVDPTTVPTLPGK